MLRVGTAAATPNATSIHPSPLATPDSTAVPPRSFRMTHDSEMYAFISRRKFRWCWLAMMLAHCVCAAFPASVGMLYRYVLTTTFMDTVVSYSLAVDRVYFEAIANGYFVFATIHCCFFVLYVVRSLRCRELVFRLPLDSATVSSSWSARRDVFPGAVVALKNKLEQVLVRGAYIVTRALLRAVLWCLPRICRRFGFAVFAAARACFAATDIQSENYELFFLFREVIQTFIQTYQAYRLSTFVPRLWMNNLTVGLIVLNCWSTPLIRVFFAKSTSVGHTRLCCALVSVLLDAVSYIFLPVVLFKPYYDQFDRTLHTYDRKYGYMDIWLIQMINELQLLFVVSLYDAFSKGTVMLSVARWLYAITKIVQPRMSLASTQASVVPSALGSPSHSSSASHSASALLGSKETVASTATVAPVSPSTQVSSRHLHQVGTTRKHRAVAWGNRFLALWGVSVLLAHLHAMSHPMFPQCRLRTRPWFTSKPGCSLIEVNCMQEKILGAASEIEHFIQRVDESHIEHLVLRHCPRLEIPAHVSALNHLMGFKVHNSSLSAWDTNAAITQARHPMLRFIFLIDVNATMFPTGLQARYFPQRLSQIVISKSNLTALPDALEASWPKRLILILEELQLQGFPYVVSRLQPIYLSLALNNLTAIPRELLEGAFVPLLILNGNPITALPSDIHDSHPHFGWLNIAATNITHLPDWMTHPSYGPLPWITAVRTPMCDRMLASGEAATALSFGGAVGLHGIDCFTESSLGNWYPVSLEATRNPSYTLESTS